MGRRIGLELELRDRSERSCSDRLLADALRRGGQRVLAIGVVGFERRSLFEHGHCLVGSPDREVDASQPVAHTEVIAAQLARMLVLADREIELHELLVGFRE
jgi:hypothetical protein